MAIGAQHGAFAVCDAQNRLAVQTGFGLRWLVCVGILALAWPASEVAGQPDEQKPPKADPELQDISVPDGTPEQLLTFIRRIQSDRPTARSRAQFVARVNIAQEAIVATADKILASDAQDEVILQAVKYKFGALSLLGRVGKPGALQRTLDFAAALKTDKRVAIVDEARRQTLIARLANLKQTNDLEKGRLVDDLGQYLEENPVRERLAVAASGAGLLESRDENQLAARAYETIARIISGSTDPMLVAYAPKFRGAARRMLLVGQTLKIDGQQADGTVFDWNAYRGRVVLVDFWATWCRPCLRELPNIKANYDKYHALGFDVVGINLDTSQRKLDQFVRAQKIPWTQLFSSDPQALGHEHPLATRFGVLQIPTSILVGKDGKVISIKARGPRLTELLARHLGAAGQATDEGTDNGTDEGTDDAPQDDENQP